MILEKNTVELMEWLDLMIQESEEASLLTCTVHDSLIKFVFNYGLFILKELHIYLFAKEMKK